jgi:uncharacterized protein YbaA (DUF1428 family)
MSKKSTNMLICSGYQFPKKCGCLQKKIAKKVKSDGDGALPEYIECQGDDVKPGKQTSFPQSVFKKDEVVFMDRL